MSIKENLTKIKEQIGNSRVKIIAVTKYANDDDIYEAYKLGINNFGESYIQDAIEKISRINSIPSFKDEIKRHFIGRLQKNKAKHVIGNFCLIHSVDSLELAELINRISGERKIIQDVLLQVNISGETSKAGFQKDDLKSVFGKIKELANIKTLGLMTIAPNSDDDNLKRDCFLKLKDLKDELNKNCFADLEELSMGMSNDYKIAIDCGATIIRIGKAIFKD